MNTATSTVRIGAIEGLRVEAIHWWAAIGACIVVLQTYVFGAWILSDKFVSTDPGPDPLTPVSAIGLRIFEVLSVVPPRWRAGLASTS